MPKFGLPISVLFDPNSIRRKTDEFRQKMEERQRKLGTTPDAMEVKLQRISNYIDDNFGCHKVYTKGLVELMMSVSLPKSSDKPVVPVEWVVGSVIVGEVDNPVPQLVVCHDDVNEDIVAIASNGDEDAGDIYEDEVRAATEDEVERFIQELSA